MCGTRLQARLAAMPCDITDWDQATLRTDPMSANIKVLVVKKPGGIPI